MTEPARYGAWAKDKPGWFFGRSAGSLIAVTAAGVPMLAAVSVHKWLYALGWLPAWALIAVAALVPIKGRSTLRWVIDSTYRTIGAVMGWSRWQSRAATGAVEDLGEIDLPGVLAGIRIHDGPPYGLTMRRTAIIQDHAARSWAAVARLAHPGIGLAEAAARNRMGAGLAELLEAAATAEIVSIIALHVRTVPDDGAERAAWQRANCRPGAPDVARQAGDQLAAITQRAGVQHETFFTIVVGEDDIAAQAKEAGGRVDGRARVLHGLMDEVESRLLGGMGCDAVSWLDSPDLAAVIRTGFAPGERAALSVAAPHGAAEPGLPLALAGPSSAPAPERRHYEHDAWSTVSCTVLLPDQGAIMGALAPVFAPGAPGERRSATVFFEPISRARAKRMVGGSKMSALGAADLRGRLGFQTRADDRKAAAQVEGQDSRLADGRTLLRAAVAAAVTVPSTWAVADCGRRLESNIRGAGFHPLRLDLAQDSGFVAACIPLGVGLPVKRSRR
jgi:hypothetical protein